MPDNFKKRAVLCVAKPEALIPQLTDYSIMIVNPASVLSRKQYLFERADWSLLIDEQGEHTKNGRYYENEKVLWYTSGTTGDSKFYSFSQQQLDLMSEKICSAYALSANDRYTSIMGLWHAHGQGFYWATQLAGCETTYLNIKNIKKLPSYTPTFVTASPDILKIVNNLSLNHLRFIRSASAPMSNELYSKLKEKFQVPVLEAFGMTEALSHCFTNPLYGEQRIGTVGLPDGIEAQIRNDQLYIKGPTVVGNDWYDTGDLAEQDDVGYYRIIGRSKDQINVRGIKINPVSIEQQLKNKVAGLIDCVVFGDTSLKCLYIGNCDATDIDKFLRSLGNHCRASLIKSVDVIPVTATGKISRTLLNSIF